MDSRELIEIDGKLFVDIILGAAKELENHLTEVNDLNVFPIPDGDTGDNMYRSLQGGIEKMLKVEMNRVDEKAKALAKGMLFSARGNSGVILSQLFKGLAFGLNGIDVATINDIKNAFKEGVKAAYKAVSEPVEGTMLTVARESTEALFEENIDNLGELANKYLSYTETSLKKTPDLLAVLKEAGVVDSGGAGIYFLALGGYKVIHDNMVVESTITAEINEQSEHFKRRRTNKDFGICVVSNGDGLKAIFEELGVDKVIDGGEGNNTSIQAFLDAFDQINAKNIFVFPNNSNIFMAVNQAKQITRKYNIHIVNSYDVGQAYSAISMIDFSSKDPDLILANMNEAISMVKTALVCKASRDANINNVDIKENSYIGFSGKTMLTSKAELVETITDLLEKLNFQDYEMATIIYGKNVSDEVKSQVESYATSKKRLFEVLSLDGGLLSYDAVVVLG